MASLAKQHDLDVWTIASADGGTTASFVPALGGIGSSFQAPFRGARRELLFRHAWFWQRDAERTRGGFPFLFPICGRLRREEQDGVYLYRGRRYRLPIHGFSLRQPWRAEDAGSDALRLRLTDTDETREAYPFSFEVTLLYRVEAGALVCTQTIVNRGPQPMPYYAGFHPYWLTPPPGAGKEAMTIHLHALRRFRYNETRTDLVGEAEAHEFPAGIASPGLHEALHEITPGSPMRLDYPDGLRLFLRVDANPAGLYPLVQLYTMPDQPFFCVEPWMSHPNGMNTIDGVRWLAPGAVDEAVLTCRAQEEGPRA